MDLQVSLGLPGSKALLANMEGMDPRVLLGYQVHQAHMALQDYKVCQVKEVFQVPMVQKVKRGILVLQVLVVHRAKMAVKAHKVPWVDKVNQVLQERGVSSVLLVLLDRLDLGVYRVNEEKLVHLAKVDFLDYLVLMGRLVLKGLMASPVQKVKRDLLVFQGQVVPLVEWAPLEAWVQRVIGDYQAILVVLVCLVCLVRLVCLVHLVHRVMLVLLVPRAQLVK